MGDGKIRTVDEVLGANVRARRTGLGLKQSDLATTLDALLGGGWSAPVVSRLESGKRATSVVELLALAFTLNATPDELLDPLAVGDERPVNLWGRWLITATKLRVLVRGEARLQTTIEGSSFSQRFSPTERGDAVAYLTLMAQGVPEEILTEGPER
jgi:transcriptional regulator with XRE-family HTH domain